MRKILFNTASAIIALSIVFTACNSEETVRIESVSLSPAALLHVDSVLDLSATIRPSFATNRTVVWTSSDNTVAIVTESATNPLVGRVTAKELGETRITVTTQDGNHTATSTVTVTMPAIVQWCNGNLPGWGTSLGTVGFATSQEWTVGNQIWSDAVTATACDKTSFDGGVADNLNAAQNADCRSNPGFPGDLFSWCAVVRFGNRLCPYPWRVPTQQDFIDLDIALGGTGRGRNNDIQFLNDNYMNPAVWGGAFSGLTTNTQLLHQGNYALYWAHHSTGLHSLALRASSGLISPRNTNHRAAGLALRCVRDNN